MTPDLDPEGRTGIQVRELVIDGIRTELEAADAADRSVSWKSLQTRFPSVSHRTFYSWVAAAKSGKVFTDRNRNDVKKKSAIDKAKAVARQLPTAPPPGYIMRHPEMAAGRLDFMAAVTAVYNDAMLLRDYSTKDQTEADGTVVQAIKIPKYFSDSLTQRVRVIETALKIQREVYELTRMQDFYDLIIKIIVVEIGPMNPEVQGRIIDQLRDLNAKYLMTVDAGMP